MTLLVLTILTPVIPLAALYVLTRSRAHSLFEWVLNIIIAGSFIFTLHVIGTWVFLSYYLRYLFLVVFIGVTAHSLLRFLQHRRGVERSRMKASPNQGTRMTTKIIYSLVGITLAGLTGRGHIAPDRTIDLSFPLRGGTYCIIQGGRNFATNPFHNFVDSEYALDIVRINRLGNRAKDLWPKKVEQYEIFGDTIYSPSQGVVYHTVNTIHDNVPPRANSRHPLGNHVVVSADDARIIVAHLMQGSILVSPGDTLTTGQPIGRVGNSGYSNEPHLHIQALRHTADNPTAGDEPVAVRFGGEFLAINDVVSSR